MKDLFQHVEHLLTEHDCIVVPGLGGFVLHDTDSRVDEAGEVFQPKGKEITFNSRLTFNDGILVQSFMENEQLTFEAAVERIHEKVAGLHELLDEGRVVAFGRLGTLLKNAEGKLTFRPDNRNLYCPESYGLTTFVYPTLEQRSKTTVTEQRHATARKRSRERSKSNRSSITFGQILAGAAACLLMLLISRPVGQLKEHEAQEAFLLHSYVDSGQRRPSMMKPPVASTAVTTQPALKDTFIPDNETMPLPQSTIASSTPSKNKRFKKDTEQKVNAKTPRERRKQPSTDDIYFLFGFTRQTADKSTTKDQTKHGFVPQQDEETSGPRPSDYFPYRSPQPHTKILHSEENAITATETAAKTAEVAKAPEAAKTPEVAKAKEVAKATVPAKKTVSPHYYIVISSHADKATATQWLDKHRKVLYEHADIIEGNDRARIYLRTFANKAEAESFLNTFREEHPQHADAWLLSKRS